MKKPDYVLHYNPTSNGHKITIMLEELGVAYDLKLVNLEKKEQFAPEFLKISPNNKIPALVDLNPKKPATGSISIFESGAILSYLANKTGKFIPSKPAGRAACFQWLFWQVSGVGPSFGNFYHYMKFAPEKIPYDINRFQIEVLRLMKVLETQLGKTKYLAGEYSIADMAVFVFMAADDRYGFKLEDFPNTYKWFTSIAKRPAIKRAYAKAVPLVSALPTRIAPLFPNK